MRIPESNKLPLTLLCGTLLRLAVFGLTSIPSIVERRPELTSPITSFRSLREGVYLYENGINPYEGGVFYHSPVYLFFFSYIVPVNSRILTAGLWTITDILAGVLLVLIWRSRPARSKYTDRDWVVALLYLFNPYTLLSCWARSTTSIDNALVLGAIAGACTGNAAAGMVALGLVTHTALYPVLLLPPLLLILNQGNKALWTRVSDAMVFVQVYATAASVFTYLLGMSWSTATLGVILSTSDLTPNVGMWWYFFNEMFDHFRPFFRGVFQFHLLIYVAPLCLRLQDPMTATLILVGAISTWKSYPTLGDMALWAGLVGCFPELISNLKHPLFSLTVHLYTCILLPLLHSLWLLTGAGNANFFYAATMVYGLNSVLAIADVLGAILSLDFKKRLQPHLYESDVEPDSMDISIVQLSTLG